MKISNFKVQEISKKLSLKEFLKEYKLKILMYVLLFGGMILGAFLLSLVQPETIKRLDFLFLNDFEERCMQTGFEIFSSSITAQFLFVLLVFFMALSPFGTIFIPLIVLFRGVGIGLSAGYLYSIHSLRGIAYYILILMPGFFVSSIALIIIALHSTRFSLKLLKKLLPKPDIERLWPEFSAFLTKICNAMILFVLSALLDMLFMAVFSNFFKF